MAESAPYTGRAAATAACPAPPRTPGVPPLSAATTAEQGIEPVTAFPEHPFADRRLGPAGTG
ncbi:hypothetical protein SCWH03_08750 [Streptomyces pacificus]|uniref:Uncharacterized protein n=1 Tax=Streptomyces pacificus TaxID=2705029 RepID=A0A6A0AQV8_9ACTN|nr:hypothetical protein SCWH03_08750 [Streptomyces pacificus]